MHQHLFWKRWALRGWKKRFHIADIKIRLEVIKVKFKSFSLEVEILKDFGDNPCSSIGSEWKFQFEQNFSPQSPKDLRIHFLN